VSVDRHSNGADLDGPEKRIKKFRRVQKQEQYAFFGPDPQFSQRVSDAVGSLQQLLVTDAFVAAFNRNVLQSTLVDVAIDEVRRGVERVRQGNHDGQLRGVWLMN
jgi:hypothetical protein